MPKGRFMMVATTAIRMESRIAVHSAGDKSSKKKGDTSSNLRFLLLFVDAFDTKKVAKFHGTNFPFAAMAPRFPSTRAKTLGNPDVVCYQRQE
jgi:hypothetical protein